jgi:hypothetical protein
MAFQVGGVSNLIQQNMAVSPSGLGHENDCAGEIQQKLRATDQSSRKRGLPKSTKTQPSGSNRNMVLGPIWGLAGPLTVGHNIILTLPWVCWESVVRTGKLVAEAWGQFANPEEGEHQSLEAAAKQRIMKTEKTLCAVDTMTFGVCNSMRLS